MTIITSPSPVHHQSQEFSLQTARGGGRRNLSLRGVETQAATVIAFPSMPGTNRVTLTLGMAAVAILVNVRATVGQLPIPLQGQRGAETPAGPARPTRPAWPGSARAAAGTRRIRRPSCLPIATASTEVTGPGRFFETLMELKPGDDLAHFKYVTKEYFVSGKAERPALQDADCHSQACRRRQVQWIRPRRVDASERQPLDVPLHPHLLDDRRSHRPGNIDERHAGIHGIQSRNATRICPSATARPTRSSRRWER